jgi:hypothetical protein
MVAVEAGYDDREIWLAANEMIKLYGDEATLQAAIRAEVMNEQGDEEGQAIWKRVLQAINELKSAKPTGTPN